MRYKGYPEKIVRILQKMYEGTFSAVRAAFRTKNLMSWSRLGLVSFGELRCSAKRVDLEHEGLVHIPAIVY